MQPIISMYMWVSLPNEVRQRIRTLFKIPRSQNVMVNDGRIETDGTTPEDFKHLTIEKMQDFTLDDSVDFHRLFDLTVQKIQEDIENNRQSIFPDKPVSAKVDSITTIQNVKKKSKQV